MKKSIFLFLLIAASYISNAQTPAVTSSTTTTTTQAAAATAKQVQNPAAWACPHCFQITKAGGMCAKCNIQTVQLGTYYCPKCMKGTGTKSGNCPMCGTATVRMTRKLCASHNTSTTPATTPAKTS